MCSFNQAGRSYLHAIVWNSTIGGVHGVKGAELLIMRHHNVKQLYSLTVSDKQQAANLLS